jgi:hypothetical protein
MFRHACAMGLEDRPKEADEQNTSRARAGAG